jgi:phosphohistidine phosphatase
MLLLFLRHADAEPFSESDFTRALTPKGVDQAKRAGKFLATHDLTPDLIFTSPLVRARETANLVAKAVKLEPSILECLACGMDLDTLMAELRPYSAKASILVVGHEPDFSHAIAELLGMPNPSQLYIRKASLTAIELFVTDEPTGRLQFSIPAKFM